MQQGSSFTIQETLSVGRSSVVFRALREADQRPVVVKALRGPHPTPEQITQLKTAADPDGRKVQDLVLEEFMPGLERQG